MISDDYILTFGKFKGQEIGSVDASYLLWLANQKDPPPAIAEYVESKREELEREAKEKRRYD